jgi:hypothetical protein
MFPSKLNVVYPEGSMGHPCKLSLMTAQGIAGELSKASLSFGWANQVKRKMISDAAIDQTVIDFYTMGQYQDLPPQKLFDTNPNKTEARMKETVEKLSKMTPGTYRLSTYKGRYSYVQASESFDPKHSTPNECDFGSMMHEITLSWSWGMKILFQRFAIRKVMNDGTDKHTWHLWPFTQPGLNNRVINVPSFLWDRANPNHPKLIPNIFNAVEGDLDSQTCYSIPYTVRKHRQGETDDCKLTAMIEGKSSTQKFHDLEFNDLSAFSPNLDDMAKCFRSLYVSSID